MGFALKGRRPVRVALHSADDKAGVHTQAERVSAPKSITKSLRIDASRNALIEQAAISAGTTFTSFILDAAAAKAEEQLLEKRLIMVESAVFADVEAMLAAERPVNQKLKALFDTFGTDVNGEPAAQSIVG